MFQIWICYPCEGGIKNDRDSDKARDSENARVTDTFVVTGIVSLNCRYSGHCKFDPFRLKLTDWSVNVDIVSIIYTDNIVHLLHGQVLNWKSHVME